MTGIPRIVHCAWLGREEMSPDRTASLASVVRNVGCPVLLVDDRTVKRHEVPDEPFHPAFDYLSVMHRVDYLRVYLMHHHGGGYTDIKRTSADWNRFFDAVEESDSAYGLGYPEMNVADVGPPLEDELRREIGRLFGAGAFIFRSGTEFTRAWLDAVNRFLDGILVDLRRSEGGEYPLEWDAVMGHILHPLLYHNRRFTSRILLSGDIQPRLDGGYK